MSCCPQGASQEAVFTYNGAGGICYDTRLYKCAAIGVVAVTLAQVAEPSIDIKVPFWYCESYRYNDIQFQLPDTLNFIRIKRGIGADQCHLFKLRLHSNQAVEWIAMVKG